MPGKQSPVPPTNPNYQVEGVPPSIKGKVTSLCEAAMDYAFIGMAEKDDRESIEQSFEIARYNLIQTIKTVTSFKKMEDLQQNFQNIMDQTTKERDEANKSAGASRSLLRRYKYKVRKQNREIEKLKQRVSDLSWQITGGN